MDKLPPPERKRRVLEGLIRFIDMATYAIAFLGGVALVVLPYGAAAGALHGFETLVALWAAFLLGGGLVGFMGRLTRYWLIENVATVAAAFGFFIYAVVVFALAFTSVAAVFTGLIALVATALMVRRWVELQIFGSEPGDWRHRLTTAWARRTRNVVDRTS